MTEKMSFEEFSHSVAEAKEGSPIHALILELGEDPQRHSPMWCLHAAWAGIVDRFWYEGEFTFGEDKELYLYLRNSVREQVIDPFTKEFERRFKRPVLDSEATGCPPQNTCSICGEPVEWPDTRHFDC
jgi:hypothetical protein